MSSAKEHLAAEVHQRIAADHDHEASKADAKEMSHRQYAQLHKSLHKASGLAEGMDGPHLGFAMQHELDAEVEKADAAHHREHAVFHRAAAADCMKATDATDLSKRGGLPRAGQQPVADKPNVPLEFMKLVQVDEQQEGL